MAHESSFVANGQEALARGDWHAARDFFQSALAEGETAEAHDGLSWAAWWLNDFDLLIRAREAGYRLYRQTGDNRGAARMAMWLAADYADFRGELSLANGWRQRARRLLDELATSSEHGWYRLLEADTALTLESDTITAKHCCAEAIAIGRSVSDIDCEMIGLAMEGFSLVSEGAVADGMQRLDEAAAAALGGELTRQSSVLWILCYLIYSCERVRDFGRAAEWCERMREFSDRLQFVFTQGICRVHYAGVLILRGQWGEAETQLSDATDRLRSSRPPWAAEGIVRIAELRRRQGRHAEAAELFRQVEWHPMALLGLAEMALEAGKPKDAEELLERVLRQLPESARYQRADAFELLVRVEALLGNHGRAAEALAEMEALTKAAPMLPLRASTCFSTGAMAVAARDYERARACFEDAVGLFERSEAPYESARARLELAGVLVSLDRLDRARDEARIAHEALQRLGSKFHVGRAAALLRDIDRRTQGMDTRETAVDSGLTRRQVEILRLISQGKGDREIAATLGVSEHTVHRHVANILLRLDLPTRAAAVAHAASRGFI